MRQYQSYKHVIIFILSVFITIGTIVEQMKSIFTQDAQKSFFNELKKSHITPLSVRLHWLPIAARIKFKVLMCAYKTTTAAAPIYPNSLMQAYAPSRSLRSASEQRLVVPSQRGIPTHGPFPGLWPAGGMTSRSQFKQLSLKPFSKNN